MRIVADENIAYVHDAFGGFGEVLTRPGRSLSRDNLTAADVLLVRSVTAVGADLLDGTPIRWVGSSTVGTDHVDEAYLKGRAIGFAHAPGSNAESVVEYVLAALLSVAVERRERLRGRTVGIVGCGNIGGRVAPRLRALGMRTLLNDPPLAMAAAEAGRPHAFVSLSDVLEESDVVTLHVPLNRGGRYSTHHLINEPALRRMRPGAWLINSCRGPVVSNAALRSVLPDGHLGATVLDVFEGEPTPDPVLVRSATLVTPHIAGYSYDGKVNGTVMLYQALRQDLGLPSRWDPEDIYKPAQNDRPELVPPDPTLSEVDYLDALVRQMYPIREDDERMRAALDGPAEARGARFSALRKHYPRRRAFSRHTLQRASVPDAFGEAVERGLCVRLV